MREEVGWPDKGRPPMKAGPEGGARSGGLWPEGRGVKGGVPGTRRNSDHRKTIRPDSEGRRSPIPRPPATQSGKHFP